MIHLTRPAHLKPEGIEWEGVSSGSNDQFTHSDYLSPHLLCRDIALCYSRLVLRVFGMSIKMGARILLFFVNFILNIPFMSRAYHRQYNTINRNSKCMSLVEV